MKIFIKIKSLKIKEMHVHIKRKVYLFSVEESDPTLHVALPAAAAVGLRLSSGVVPAV